ncbi:hypothetical protein QUB68_24740 [Microcoleus sp. A006_D1]
MKYRISRSIIAVVVLILLVISAVVGTLNFDSLIVLDVAIELFAWR